MPCAKPIAPPLSHRRYTADRPTRSASRISGPAGSPPRATSRASHREPVEPGARRPAAARAPHTGPHHRMRAVHRSIHRPPCGRARSGKLISASMKEAKAPRPRGHRAEGRTRARRGRKPVSARGAAQEPQREWSVRTRAASPPRSPSAAVSPRAVKVLTPARRRSKAKKRGRAIRAGQSSPTAGRSNVAVISARGQLRDPCGARDLLEYPRIVQRLSRVKVCSARPAPYTTVRVNHAAPCGRRLRAPPAGDGSRTASAHVQG